MYTSKNDLIARLVNITGETRSKFIDKTVKELNEMINDLDSLDSQTYLDVPYKDRKKAELLGAEYDSVKKKWYIPQGAKKELFNRWL